MCTMDLLDKVRKKTSYPFFEESFEKSFKKIFVDIFEKNMNNYSEFIFSCKYKDYKSHPLFSQILQLHSIFLNKFLLDNLQNKDLLKNMDNALSLFIFSFWTFNTVEENLMNVRIILLFREFLNFIGWDHLQLLANYKIVENKYEHLNEEYSKCMLAENLPELLDDFLGVFLSKDAPNFTNNFSEVKYFVTEFCNFLNNEGLINYMIEPLD